MLQSIYLKWRYNVAVSIIFKRAVETCRHFDAREMGTGLHQALDFCRVSYTILEHDSRRVSSRRAVVRAVVPHILISELTRDNRKRDKDKGCRECSGKIPLVNGKVQASY